MESLTLKFSDIDIMKKDFKQQAKLFTKEQIKQTTYVLTQMKHFMIQNNKRIQDFSASKCHHDLNAENQ